MSWPTSSQSTPSTSCNSISLLCARSRFPSTKSINQLIRALPQLQYVYLSDWCSRSDIVAILHHDRHGCLSLLLEEGHGKRSLMLAAEPSIKKLVVEGRMTIVELRRVLFFFQSVKSLCTYPLKTHHYRAQGSSDHRASKRGLSLGGEPASQFWARSGVLGRAPTCRGFSSEVDKMASEPPGLNKDVRMMISFMREELTVSLKTLFVPWQFRKVTWDLQG